jgi:LysR family transcriptional regulator, transcriptional activator of nhaA
MFNFNHLYYFYITAKSGSTTVAAHHLKVSQPSLSSQLKILESAIDMTLFRRVGRANQLTEAGTIIYGFCRRMFEISEEMKEIIVERVPSAARRINIGVSDEVERSFAVEVVSLFLKKHGLEQRPKVTMVSGSHEQLVERLRFRELDAVVTQLAMTDPDLMSLMRTEVPVALVCSNRRGERTKSDKKKDPSAIPEIVGGKAAQWVMPSSSFKLRSEIDRFFELHELKGRIVFESDVMGSLVRSVIDEIGFSFLPLLYVTRELRKKSIRILGPKEGYWKYRVWLGCHSQNSEDLLIQSLARSFKDVCDQALGSITKLS